MVTSFEPLPLSRPGQATVMHALTSPKHECYTICYSAEITQRDTP